MILAALGCMIACCRLQPADALTEKEIESKANALIAARKYREAMQLVEPQIVLTPKNAELYGYRASVYLNHHQEKEALADLQTLYRLEPANTRFIPLREEAFLQTGQFARALADCNKMLALRVNDAMWYARRAKCEARLNDRRAAAADLQKALSIDPYNYDALMFQYDTCIDRLEESAALVPLNKILSKHPADSAVLLLRAGLFEVLERRPEAMIDVSKAIASDPHNWPAWEFRAKLKWEMGEKKSAIQDYDCVIAQTRGDSRSMLLEHRGKMYEELGDTRNAISDYSTAIRLAPRHANVTPELINRAKLYAKMGNFAEAIADFGSVLEQTPLHIAARQGRASAFYGAHKYEDAVRDYTKLIELDRDSRWFTERARAERNLGKAELAARDEQQAKLFRKGF